MKEEKFPHSRKPSHRQVCGEFCNLRRQHNQEGEKKKKKPMERHLMEMVSREVAQTLPFATSELQTVSRLPVANHVFLGSWMVEICQQCHTLRSASHR